MCKSDSGRAAATSSAVGRRARWLGEPMLPSHFAIRAQASRTVCSAVSALIANRVCPASCAFQSSSPGARSNRCELGSRPVGPHLRYKSPATLSIAPASLSAQRSYRSRAARRSCHVAVLPAAKAGKVGTSSSAGGASLYRCSRLRSSVGHTARPRGDSNWILTDMPDAERRLAAPVSGTLLSGGTHSSRP